ncbi:MAG: dethiobiotin synthase [Deltaproteobacteria bacterium]|nr:dethiobiotin synthase [Deltaproteobacteria bacterium]
MDLLQGIPTEADTIEYTTVRGLKLTLPYLCPTHGVFVTGTDTNVGKTWVAAGLTWAVRRRDINACYFKPVQSGCPEEGGRLIPTDAAFAGNLAGLDEPLELLTPVALRLPLAPAVAAREEGVEVDFRQIARAWWQLARKYEYLVVEGAGGLCVPLAAKNFLVLDLIRWLRLPLVVVARAGLGTINHTVLTVKAAQQAGAPVVGVILNQYPATPSLAARTNPEVIEDLADVPVLGRAPQVQDLNSPAGREQFWEAMDQVCSSLAQAAQSYAFLKFMVDG